jgi:hypothetical protein
VALVPYADLINHSPFSTAYINAQPGEKSIFGDEPDRVVVGTMKIYPLKERKRESLNIRVCMCVCVFFFFT